MCPGRASSRPALKAVACGAYSKYRSLARRTRYSLTLLDVTGHLAPVRTIGVSRDKEFCRKYIHIMYARVWSITTRDVEIGDVEKGVHNVDVEPSPNGI